MNVKISNPILKAKEEPNSRRFAINAMCASCMGCTETAIVPGFRKEVRECSAPRCPLYAFRPYQHDDDEVEEEAVMIVENVD